MLHNHDQHTLTFVRRLRNEVYLPLINFMTLIYFSNGMQSAVIPELVKYLKHHGFTQTHP